MASKAVMEARAQRAEAGLTKPTSTSTQAYIAAKTNTPSTTVSSTPTTTVSTSTPTTNIPAPIGAPIPTTNPSITGNTYGDDQNVKFNQANNIPQPIIYPGLTPATNIQPTQIVQQQQQQQQYNSPYASQIADVLVKLSNMLSNPNQFNPDTDAGLKIAQQQAMLQADKNAARRNMLYANSSKYGQNSALQAAQNLIPQYQQMFNQNEQTKMNNIYNQLAVLQGLDKTGYDRSRDLVMDNRYNQQQTNNQLLNLGQVVNPLTGRVEQTPATKQNEIDMYVKSISGLGDSFDYQAEINKITNDSDTSNDWKIPYLKQQRESKVQANLQRDLATIGQYSDNYQAEIDRRTTTNPNDPLIPYLKVARAQKIATQKAEALSRQDKMIKDAYDKWKVVGIADQTIASILGIPVGSKTADYMKAMADINQSNASAQASLINASANAQRASTDASELLWKKEQAQNVSGDMKYSSNYAKSIERIDNLYNNELAPLRNAKDYRGVPGSVEQLRLIREIAAEPITNYEKQLLFQKYGIDYNIK